MLLEALVGDIRKKGEVLCILDMLGEAALVLGTNSGFYAAQDLFTGRYEFLEIFDFAKIRGRFVLAKKAFHKATLYQNGISLGLMVSSSVGCSTGVSSIEGV